jgi:hypothetical protein
MATRKDKINIIPAQDISEDTWQMAIERQREKLNINYQIVSFGRFAAGYHASTVRDAFMDKQFRDKAFKSVGSQIAAIKLIHAKSKIECVDGAVEAWVDGMTNFPKIIIENTFDPPDNFHELFIEEGKILLPFPKIVVITGSVRVGDEKAIPQGHVNEFVFCVVEQDANDLRGILVHFCVQDGTNMKIAIATLGVYVSENPESHVLEIRPLIPQSQIGWLDVNEMQLMIHRAMSAIYMMTFHDGDVCISVPTPREIQVNQKKIRKGKTPLVEFKLISILGKKRELPSVPHGSHASPRQHWRRGHWRSYRSGKRSWVAPMLVGDEENGKVVKDYAIGNYPEDANMHFSKLSV